MKNEMDEIEEYENMSEHFVKFYQMCKKYEQKFDKPKVYSFHYNWGCYQEVDFQDYDDIHKINFFGNSREEALLKLFKYCYYNHFDVVGDCAEMFFDQLLEDTYQIDEIDEDNFDWDNEDLMIELTWEYTMNGYFMPEVFWLKEEDIIIV